METNEFYRPVNIEFNVTHDGSKMPVTLGEFATAEEAQKHMSNLTCTNQRLPVARLLDNTEKAKMRGQYTALLEDQLPIYEAELSDAENKLAAAKKVQKQAEDALNANTQHAHNLSAAVKRGLKDMELDEKYTYRVAYKGRYYFYTWMDKQLKLCAIRDIPELEKGEIWNQMAGNEEWVDGGMKPKPPVKEAKPLNKRKNAKKDKEEADE
jgi:hypothetical protein